MRAIQGVAIACIGMAHHTCGWIVPQNSRNPAVCVLGAIAADHHARMLREPHPYATTMMQGTQVAPEAVFRSAFNKGQSDTASEPSFMLSVSRFGEATEPESR